MPRVNRLERAIEHPNPVVGCIMLVQEKMKFLGRALLRCHCSEYEEELASLRTELSILREQFRAQRDTLRRLHLRGQEAMVQYRQRITSLLQVNSRRLALELPQRLAVRSEIQALRLHVEELRVQLVQANILPNSPSSRAISEWQMSLIGPPSWSISPAWQSLHPGQSPTYDPNPPQVPNDVPSQKEESNN